MSSPIYSKNDKDISGYRCSKCPGLILTADLLEEQGATCVCQIARKRDIGLRKEGYPDKECKGNLGQALNKMWEPIFKKRKMNKGANRRKQAVVRQNALAEKRVKLGKARKDAELVKARNERAARTLALIKKRVSAAVLIVSKGKQNLGQDLNKGGSFPNRDSENQIENKHDEGKESSNPVV